MRTEGNLVQISPMRPPRRASSGCSPSPSPPRARFHWLATVTAWGRRQEVVFARRATVASITRRKKLKGATAHLTNRLRIKSNVRSQRRCDAIYPLSQFVRDLAGITAAVSNHRVDFAGPSETPTRFLAAKCPTSTAFKSNARYPICSTPAHRGAPPSWGTRALPNIPQHSQPAD